MDNQFFLRRADIGDINALSQLGKKSFLETFVEGFSIQISEKDLDSYFSTSTSPEWFANKIADSQGAVWVIEDKTNGELVAYGVASCCDGNDISHPDICSNKDGVLNRLYVRRNQQGHGFGQQLVNVMLPWLEEHFHGRPIWLIVWPKNMKALKFYKYYGFSEVGYVECHVGEQIVYDCLMKRQTHIS